MRSRRGAGPLGYLLFVLLGTVLVSGPARALTVGVESHLARAAAFFHTGDLAEADKAVDAALAIDPSSREAGELKALLLKTSGRTPEAFRAYQALLKSAKAAHLAVKSQAAYLFEIGVIDFQTEQYPRAAKEFASVRQVGFNLEAAAFFQALSMYRMKDLSAADDLFAALSRALPSSQSALRASSDYYRARIALEEGGRERAIALLESAKLALAADAAGAAGAAGAEGGGDVGADGGADGGALASRISELIDAALGSGSANRTVAGLETLTEYDSNATLLSDTLAAYQTPSTIKQTLLAAVANGRRSQTSAWSVSGRSIINYNFNKQTKSAEFAANELEGNWLFKNYGSTRVGVTAHGLALFRNQSAGAGSGSGSGSGDGGESFRTYLFTGIGGVAFERVTARGQWRGELGLGPARYLDDGDFDPTQARTGTVAEGFLSWRRDLDQGLWNPSSRFELFKQMTEGREFRGTYYRLSFGDTLYAGKWRVSLDATAGYATYPDRPGGRTDWLYGLDSLGARQISARFAFLLRAGTAKNASSVPELYSYDRYSIGAGVRLIF